MNKDKFKDLLSKISSNSAIVVFSDGSDRVVDCRKDVLPGGGDFDSLQEFLEKNVCSKCGK